MRSLVTFGLSGTKISSPAARCRSLTRVRSRKELGFSIAVNSGKRDVRGRDDSNCSIISRFGEPMAGKYLPSPVALCEAASWSRAEQSPRKSGVASSTLRREYEYPCMASQVLRNGKSRASLPPFDAWTHSVHHHMTLRTHPALRWIERPSTFSIDARQGRSCANEGCFALAVSASLSRPGFPRLAAGWGAVMTKCFYRRATALGGGGGHPRRSGPWPSPTSIPVPSYDSFPRGTITTERRRAFLATSDSWRSHRLRRATASATAARPSLARVASRLGSQQASWATASCWAIRAAKRPAPADARGDGRRLAMVSLNAEIRRSRSSIRRLQKPIECPLGVPEYVAQGTALNIASFVGAPRCVS